MIPNITNWFKDLSPLQKIAVGLGTCTLGSLLVWWRLGWKVFLLALAAILLVVVLLLLFQKVLNQIWRAKGRDMQGEILGDIKKANAEIGERFDLAFRDLKTNGVDIYRLPWFLWVGEPGGGKSYTIKKSGLDFPLGEEEISGAGGTRNVDFWFTEYAVILDTAGRLTIQEDNSVLDIAQWNEFLRLLRTSRINCPINGVLIGIPCTSLLSEDAATREKKAAKIQTRLRDLMKALQIHFPVWVIVLKTDLVMGFEQFCSRLPSLERKQLFGWSKEGPFDRPFDPMEFDKAFDGVYQELHRWRLRFLNEELSTETADQLYLFPEEFHALKSSLAEYLKKIFGKLDKKKEADREEVYKQPGFFRGIYFTSSLQSGSSIPNAIRGLLEGVGEQDTKAEAGLEIEASSTPTFVRDLYAEKVFEEKGLVLRTDRSKLMNDLIRGVSRWGGILVVALGLFFIVYRYLEVKSLLGEAPAMIQKIDECKTDRTHDDLKHLASLGSSIADWEKNRNEAWALRSFFRYFSPSPSYDHGFLTKLKSFHNWLVLQRHLLPFLDQVQKELLGSPVSSGDGTAGHVPPPTWKDLVSRSRRFLGLLEIDLDLKSRANPTSNLKDLFGPREEADPSPESYGNQLAAEYERFLLFGRDPECPVPGRTAAYGADEMEKIASGLKHLLTTFLDTGQLQAGSGDATSDFGVCFGDDLRWWRGLLHKCDAFNRAYLSLLSISAGNLPAVLDTPEAFKERWLNHASGFNAVNTRWNELQAYISSSRVLPDDELLAQRFQSLERQIDDFYITQCNKILSDAGDAKATELNRVLFSHHKIVKATFDAFRGDLETKLNASSHLISYFKEPEKPRSSAPGSDTATVLKFSGAQLTAEAQYVLRQLKAIDEVLKTDPKTILDSRALRAGTSDYIEHIPTVLDNAFKSLSRAIQREQAQPVTQAWNQDGLKGLIDAGTLCAFSHLASEVFNNSYFTVAEEVDKTGIPTIDHWFKVPSDANSVVRGTLLEGNIELDGLYQKVCHDRLKTHIERLKQVLKDNPKVYPAVQGQLQARLSALLLRYEHRLLDHWEKKLNRSQLSFEGWQGGGKGLEVVTNGKIPIADLAPDVVKTIERVQHEIAGVIKEKSGLDYDWAKALMVYDDGRRKKLEEKLKKFAKLLKDTQDPVDGLKAVYAPESEWLATDDLNIPKDDIVAKRLNALSDQGKRILASECWKEFRKDWHAMRGQADSLLRVEDPKQQGQFTIQFPFTGGTYADYGCNFIGVSQVAPSDFLRLLGKDKVISTVIERYEFFLDHKEVIQECPIPREIAEFLRNCRSLRNFMLDDKKANFRAAIRFNLSIPPRNDADIEDRKSIYDQWSRFKWKLGNVEKAITPSVDGPIKDLEWRPPRREYAANDIFGCGVLKTEDDYSPVVKYKAVPGQEVKCADQWKDEEIELKLEARGPWSLIVFLCAYGTRQEGGSRWRIEYDFRRMAEFEKDDYTLVYFDLEFVDKGFEAFPDWGAVREKWVSPDETVDRRGGGKQENEKRK